MGEFLPYIGAALQWARARKKFGEIWYVAIVTVASFVGYIMAHPSTPFAVAPGVLLGEWWHQAQAILAMTQVVSSGSNVLTDMRGSGAPIPVALPVTNSQG